MKKNLIISLVVISAILLGCITAFAGNMITKKVACPNCGTEVEIQTEAPVRGGFGGRHQGRHGFDKKVQPKTLDELKADLAAMVAEGKLTQEEADKRIASYEKWQENAKKREEAQAKRKEEYKAKLAEKVAAGEMTQEQADKLLENYGKRGNRTGRGNRGNGKPSFDFGKKAQPKTMEEFKADLAAKVAEGKLTQEQADKMIAGREKMEENAKKWQENAKKWQEEQAKRKEEYKAELTEKVTKGEIAQEEADKLLANYGKRGNFRGNFKPKTLEEYKAELTEKVAKGEITQEQADKLIAEFEARAAKFKEMSAKRGENRGKAPFRGNFGGRGKGKAPEKSDK